MAFLSRNWGNLASVIGLVVGALALWQAYLAARNADNAATVANEVRKELLKRSVAEELRWLCDLLSPALILIRQHSPEAALALIDPAISGIFRLKSRWRLQLDRNQATRLTRSITQLKSASVVLGNQGINDNDYSMCFTATQGALHLIIEVQGGALADLDGDEVN